MTHETCSADRLESICLDALKGCDGFDDVERIVVQSREAMAGNPNWAVAAVRPKVDNGSLRGARDVIDRLQGAYRLDDTTVKQVAHR